MVAAAALAVVFGARVDEEEVFLGLEYAGMVVKKDGQPVPDSYFIRK